MERFVIGMLFESCGTTNIQRFHVRETKSLSMVGFYICVCLEVLKFSATSELRIFEVDLNRSRWRIKGLQRPG